MGTDMGIYGAILDDRRVGISFNPEMNNFYCYWWNSLTSDEKVAIGTDTSVPEDLIRLFTRDEIEAMYAKWVLECTNNC